VPSNPFGQAARSGDCVGREPFCWMSALGISRPMISLPSFGKSWDARHGRVVLAKGPAKRVAWVANIGCDPMRIPIASIGDAAKKLGVIQRN
jgi:hypothetical protein